MLPPEINLQSLDPCTFSFSFLLSLSLSLSPHYHHASIHRCINASSLLLLPPAHVLWVRMYHAPHQSPVTSRQASPHLTASILLYHISSLSSVCLVIESDRLSYFIRQHCPNPYPLSGRFSHATYRAANLCYVVGS
jgi:hypothetical protein